MLHLFCRSCFDSTITYESLIRDAKGATKRLLTDLDISQSYIDQVETTITKQHYSSDITAEYFTRRNYIGSLVNIF